jgi:hypothetical protein
VRGTRVFRSRASIRTTDAHPKVRRRRCSTAGISLDPVAIRGEQLVDALNKRAARRPFAARTSKGPGSSSGALPSFRTVPFATADFCKNMPSCIFAVLQKRHFLQKIKLGEIP